MKIPISLPELSKVVKRLGPGAEQRWSRGQALTIVVLAALIVLSIILFRLTLLQVFSTFVSIATIFFVLMLMFSLVIAARGMKDGTIMVTPEEIQAIQVHPHKLPFITILAAGYLEASVAEQFVRSISSLIYPNKQSRMQVIVVLEEKDTATINAFRATKMPSYMQIMVRPKGGIMTKPAALNYVLDSGVIDPRSEITCVFDMEDIPDTDQVLKAVVAFNKAYADDPSIVCVQARLSFDQNMNHNWITSMLAQDYLQHFGIILPGLSKMGLISPLGGTSNYILTHVLRHIKWDPYNVTEDMNLAVFFRRLGLGVRVFNSVTSEEAVTSVRQFVKQRSRWIKGGIQTYIRHMRNPYLLYKDLGVLGFIGFQAIVGAPLVLNLINPIFWTLTLLYAVTHWEWIEQLYGMPAIFYMASICLVFGNFLYIYFLMLAGFSKKKYGLVVYALTAPLYWVLLSAAGIKAVIEYFASTKSAQTWDKTTHVGVSPLPTPEHSNIRSGQFSGAD